jgi:hypothetical protein
LGKQGKHNFSASQCWAIWTAYGMKCFWCKKALEFTECQIDQVIPKSVTKIVLTSIIKDHNLGADFSTNSYANWVAACKPCSKKRSGSPFRPGPSLPSWFESIRHKAQQVEAKVKRIDGEQLPDSLLRQLVQKLEQG